MKLFRTFLTLTLIFALCSVASGAIINPGQFIEPGVIGGMLIFTAPGGIATPFSFNMTYLPEFLSYNPGANPLTSLRVETQEDGVLHDWNAAAIAAMNGFMKVGTVTANDVNLRLADGELRPKNVTISGVTSAAGAVRFYVCSDNKGLAAFKSSNAAILASIRLLLRGLRRCSFPQWPHLPTLYRSRSRTDIHSASKWRTFAGFPRIISRSKAL